MSSGDSTGPARSAQDIGAWCADYVSTVLNVPTSRIDWDAKFSRLGLDSATSIYLIAGLEEWLGIDVSPEIVFEYQTINALSSHLAARQTGSR